MRKGTPQKYGLIINARNKFREGLENKKSMLVSLLKYHTCTDHSILPMGFNQQFCFYYSHVMRMAQVDTLDWIKYMSKVKKKSRNDGLFCNIDISTPNSV